MATHVSLTDANANCPRVIVADEQMMCGPLSSILDDQCQVTCATTSGKALMVLAERPIDVMLLDYHLRTGGADDVARQAVQSGIPMACMSGDHAVESEGDFVLLKPFLIAEPSKIIGIVKSSAGRPVLHAAAVAS